MNPENQECANCLYYARSAGYGAIGVCRRWPPSGPADRPTRYPHVYDHDWCGEYQAGPAATDSPPAG